ncbi:hypothetical protein [Eubacterium aggregans]|uniref:hypothetical protein n=1 Tax=Eubacterium aggregans TaxID=81409 RepID=UPI003F39DA05
MIVDGERLLVKGGSGYQQEPYNEVLASLIMDRLGIVHVPYTLLMEKNQVYSVCPDFVTPETEMVTAWHLMQTQKKLNHHSYYEHYLRCCDAFEIPKIRDVLDQMIIIDYLMANEDRHLNNFGVLRNAETLEYLGAAPLLDTGTALWFDRPTVLIGETSDLVCKPFKQSHKKQIALVRSFEWLDLSRLNGIEDELRELMHGSIYIDEKRCDALCSALNERITQLGNFIGTRSENYITDHRKDDVTGDVAYSGSIEHQIDDEWDEEI